MLGSRTSRIRRARLVPIALTTAALSSAVLGASVTGTLSAFNASITNTTNTAASGSLVMKETGPDNSTICLSSSGSNNNYASCGTINKYGGATFTPGTTKTTTVTVANTGSATVTAFKIHADTCTKTNLSTSTTTGSLCDSLQLTLTCTVGTNAPLTVYSAQSLTAIATTGDQTIPAGCFPGANGSSPVQFAFALTLPTTADSSVQAQQVSQPLTWTFTGA